MWMNLASSILKASSHFATVTGNKSYGQEKETFVFVIVSADNVG
ncbi:hypothetical protein AB6E04_08310 [Vibrio amylolyticus]